MLKGVGLDVVEIDRMARILEGDAADRFLERVYTPEELAYCLGKARKVEHLAARLAAKEAVFKALGTGWSEGIGWKDVEVRHDQRGRPCVVLHGKALEIFGSSGGGEIFLSVSHTSRLAMAQAIWSSS